MHPRQANLLSHTKTVVAKLSPKEASPVLWKYTCPETNEAFYLGRKALTIKSPFTGKTFAAKPERMSITDVGQEMKAGPGVQDESSDTVIDPATGLEWEKECTTHSYNWDSAKRIIASRGSGWRLPTKEEAVQASKTGLFKDGRFYCWTSTPSGSSGSTPLGVSFDTGRVYGPTFEDFARHLRCVRKP